jgi:hypothetical protein
MRDHLQVYQAGEQDQAQQAADNQQYYGPLRDQP